MLKKDIRAFFKAIRRQDCAFIVSQLDAIPELLTARSVGAPKADDGQSSLQVALKVRAFEIVEHLVACGADVNFRETSQVNEWTAPVLHDAIRALGWTSHTMDRTQQQFERAFRVFRLLLSKGADPNGTDSYGNTCFCRAGLDARTFILHPAADLESGIVVAQFRRIVAALVTAGGDLNARGQRGTVVREAFEEKGLGQFRLLADIP